MSDYGDDPWDFREHQHDEQETYDPAGVGQWGTASPKEGKTNMAKKEYVKVLTPVFRVSFPAVFAPKKMGDSGDPQYSVLALFRLAPDPKDPTAIVADAKDFQALRDLATGAAVTKWGADRAKWPTNLQTPFRDGKEKDYDGFGEGVVFCTFKSDYKPGLVDGQLKEIIDPKEFYGGCYARAKVSAYAWTYMGKNGVSFSLWHVQKYKDGAPFGGGGDASKEFDALPLPAGAVAGAPTPTPAAAGGGFGL